MISQTRLESTENAPPSKKRKIRITVLRSMLLFIGFFPKFLLGRVPGLPPVGLGCRSQGETFLLAEIKYIGTPD